MINNINSLRNEIRSIDYKIIKLIKKRIEIGKKILILKIKNNKNIRDNKYEKKVINRAILFSKKLNINVVYIWILFKILINLTLREQKKLYKKKYK